MIYLILNAFFLLMTPCITEEIVALCIVKFCVYVDTCVKYG